MKGWHRQNVRAEGGSASDTPRLDIVLGFQHFKHNCAGGNSKFEAWQKQEEKERGPIGIAWPHQLDVDSQQSGGLAHCLIDFGDGARG